MITNFMGHKSNDIQEIYVTKMPMSRHMTLKQTITAFCACQNKVF